MRKHLNHKHRKDPDPRVSHILIAFTMGVIFGVGLFATLLFYLDTTDTDAGFLNAPSPRATCYSMQKLGLNVWFCTRHHVPQ